MRTGRLLVIGAGPVGLGMADALSKAGIDYEQVDANSGLGGLWRQGIYANVHIVSSKRSTAYADYPMPAHYPDFPSAAQMLAYLESYARDRGLIPRIEFDKKVSRAVPNRDDSWTVAFADGEQRVYKGLVVCNGHHWDPIRPRIAGTFSGPLLHAKDYRSAADISGKRVLVVGGGNSGCDIVSEAARVAASADWSLREGAWFFPKFALGRPLTDLPIWSLPIFAQRFILKRLIRMFIGRYEDYGLPTPTHRIFERHPTFGTEALGYVRQGRIRPRTGVVRAEGSTVHFTDGSSAEYDVIVTATGYRLSFPFLPPDLIEVKDNVAQIYGGAFPAGIKNLYIVGSEQPRNGFGSLLTPAAGLYARLIRMQDEFTHPIGSILKFGKEKIPPTPFIDPARARRQIRWGHRLLPILRLEARLLERREAYQPIASASPAPPLQQAAE
ncbi:MAG: NAD(P)-binding domain-containing protein [Proteobacteria bacterium]|nr:NAD(P)-binding domain-containing protein [Pseudomonadota bacterium]